MCIWCCWSSMQSWHKKMEHFPKPLGLHIHLSILSGKAVWRSGRFVKKPGAEVKIPSITLKLTSPSFTANWAIWPQFKVLYWLNKPEPLKCLSELLPETAWEYSHNILFPSKQPQVMLTVLLMLLPATTALSESLWKACYAQFSYNSPRL